MGGKQSLLRDVEGGEPLSESCQLYKLWTSVFPGRYQKQTPVTVFVRDFADTDSTETRKFFENGIQTLRQLRHPGIVAFVAGCVEAEEACLVTERVTPLELVVDSLHPVEILCGLLDLMYTLIFIHDKGDLFHNNVSLSSVFVAKDGSWRIGGFECTLKKENSRHWVLSDFVKAIKEPAFIPPEDQQLMKKEVPVHSRDSYGFGKLVEYLIPFLENSLSEQKLSELQKLVDALTADDAALRPQLGLLIPCQALKNDLSDLIYFLRRIPLVSSQERDDFFEGLVPRLRNLEVSVLCRRLTKLLVSRYVLLELVAVQFLLPDLLNPLTDENADEVTEDGWGPLIPLELFQRFLVPELNRIFCIHETAIRLALLTHFNHFVQAFRTETLRQTILPELLLGMKDTDEKIIAASMRCLGELVPLLGAEAVTGLKHRKYFVEGRPRRALPLPPKDSLQNIKQALEENEQTVKSYDEAERRRNKLEKMEERRKILENKKHERKQKLLISKKLRSEDVSESSANDPVAPVPHNEDILEDLTPAGESWEEWEEPSPVSERQQPPPAKISERAASLGAEFDISALEFTLSKSSLDEPDYFADMEPDLGSNKSQSPPKQKPMNLFDMATAQEEPGGWESSGWVDED